MLAQHWWQNRQNNENKTIFNTMFIFLLSCKGQKNSGESNKAKIEKERIEIPKARNTEFDIGTKTIHIIVAL